MLKTLIIGCGNIAGGFDAQRAAGSPPLTHAGAYAAHGGFELVACVEPDAERREAFVKRWGIGAGYSDMAQLTASGARFDVISICSPTPAHLEDTESALRLGPRLVFCEKPVCRTVQQAEYLVMACAAQGVALAVNHNRRWDASVERLRDDIASGVWGSLRSASGLYNKGILNNGSHLIDLLHCLVGPLTLRHAGAAVHDFWPDDPSFPALLETQAGAPVALNCGHAADYALFELQLVFEKGTITMEDSGMQWRQRLPAPSGHFSGYTALAQDTRVAGDYPHAMSNVVANIYHAVVNGAAIACTGETALVAQRLCDQIRHAAEHHLT